MERAQVAPINQMLTQHLGPLTSLGSDNTPQPSAGLTPPPLALTEPAQEAAIRHSLLKWDRYNPMAGWQLYRTYPDQAEADYWFEFLSDHWAMDGSFDGTVHGWQVVPADEVEAFIEANKPAPIGRAA